jgi:peptidoglycan/xylan/chitin deacetylase (PgdA/CDA1 family)
MSPARSKKPGVARNLAYHEITAAEPLYLYGVSADRFKMHVQRVAQMNSVSATSASPLQISFDDGHASQFEFALPVLEEFSVKAQFFITAGWTEKKNGYMSWAQLANLAALGHDVQAHGWSHKLLTHCSDDELEEELKRSKGEMENRLGKKVDALSAPGGRCNEKVLAAGMRIGYRRVFTSNPWSEREYHQDISVFGRWMITRQMNELQLANMVEGKGLGLQHAKYRMKETLKKVLGDRAYQSLWRSMSRKNESLEGTEEKTPDSARI